MPDRLRRSALVLGGVALVFYANQLRWDLRVALLPDDLGPMPTAVERAAWLDYVEALQCEALEPCLDSLTATNWEGDPGRIARACDAAHARIEALPVPALLGAAPRAHAELLRDYWLGETARHAEQASPGDGGGWAGVFAPKLETCADDSLPARLDAHYGLDVVGPAGCEDIRAAREAS